MPTPTLYRHDDASAPVLTGQAGSLIALLDAILVNGYGAKAAAGWTKPFSGTNKAVYRNAGTQTYFRIDDTNAAFGALPVCEIIGFVTMSDVDTGTGQFPTPTQISTRAENRKMITKSSTDDATAIPWVALATSRAIIIHTDWQRTASRENGHWHMFGDYKSFVPSDTSNAAILCYNYGGTSSPGFTTNWGEPYAQCGNDLDTTSDLEAYHCALRKSIGGSFIEGAGASLQSPQIADTNQNQQSGTVAYSAYPHPIYGLPLGEQYIVDTHAAIIRGVLPGVLYASVDLYRETFPFAVYEQITVNDPVEGPIECIYLPYSRLWASSGSTGTGGYMLRLDGENWL